MVELLLNPVVRSLGCTPFHGIGYAWSLVDGYSSFSDEEKAERSAADNKAGNVFNVAAAAEAVADAAADVASAPRASPAAVAAAKMATTAATGARAHADTVSANISASRREVWQRRLDTRVAATAAPAAASAAAPEVGSSVEHKQSRAPRGGRAEPWTPAEDEQLLEHVAKYGPRNWKVIAEQLSLVRPASADSVNLHWKKLDEKKSKMPLMFTVSNDGRVLAL